MKRNFRPPRKLWRIFKPLYRGALVVVVKIVNITDGTKSVKSFVVKDLRASHIPYSDKKSKQNYRE